MNEPIIIARDTGREASQKSVNLTALPGLGRLIRNPWALRSLHLASVGLLVLAIYLGLVGENRKTGLTLLLFWGVFWPLLASIAIPSFGAVFCAICPHGALGRFLQKYSLKKRFPRRLQNAWISIVLMVFGYWFFAYSMSGFLGESTFNTAWYFLAFTLLAVSVFLVYDNMAYCKYVCPLGRVVTTHGKLGALSIKSDQNSCQTCTHFSCAKACPYHLSPFNFERNNNAESCTLCLECVYSCSSIELHAQWPGQTIAQPIKRSTTNDYWVFLAIFATAAVGIQFLHGLQHTGLQPYLPWNIVGGWLQEVFSINGKSFNASGFLAFVTALASTALVASYATRTAGKLSKKHQLAVPIDFIYALAPVAVLGLIPHSVVMFATQYAHLLVQELGALWGAVWIIEPLAKRGDAWLSWMNLLPWLGIVWGLKILWRRSAYWQASRRVRIQLWLLLGLPIWYYSIIMLAKMAARIWLVMPALHH